MKKILILLTILLLVGCQKSVIKIGFIGDLSSERSQLAVDGRNAAQLYIQLLNDEEGINGHQLELVIKDDAGDVDIATKRHDEFVSEGVKFIIGHMTSDMAQPVILAKEKNLLFVSPSMSTDLLTGLDDNFIRTSPVNSRQAIILNEYCQKNELDDIVIVFDIRNEEYTKNLHDYFKWIYEQDGYLISGSIPFDSQLDEMDDISDQIIDLNPETVFMISQASSTAYLSQKLKLFNTDVNLISVSWSMTNDLIKNGGNAVEDCIFVGIYKPESNSEAYNKFYTDFTQRYDYEPSFISSITTDSMVVLSEALKNSPTLQIEDVKEALINQKYTALQEVFVIDGYGDSTKQYMLYQLKNGKFEPMRGW